MIQRKILNLEKRRNIYNIISKNPGIHLRDISRKTKIPKTTVEYHLRYLQKREMIIKKVDKSYGHYFISNKIGNGDKEILYILRQTVPRKIMLILLIYTACSEMDLARELDKHQSTISYHLQKLIKNNIVEAAPYQNGSMTFKTGRTILRPKLSNETFYKLKDQEALLELLIRHQQGFLDDPTFTLVILWLKVHLKEIEMPQKRKKFGYWFDQFIEGFYEIFPHPYHV